MSRLHLRFTFRPEDVFLTIVYSSGVHGFASLFSNPCRNAIAQLLQPRKFPCHKILLSHIFLPCHIVRTTDSTMYSNFRNVDPRNTTLLQNKHDTRRAKVS